MGGRTLAAGNIRGDLAALSQQCARLPTGATEATVVFLGDDRDRELDPAGLPRGGRELPCSTQAAALARRGPRAP